jgi:hypothetical protein
MATFIPPKRGKVVAVLVPPPAAPAGAEGLHGVLRGSVIIPPGLDLTAPGLGRRAHGCGTGHPTPVSAVVLDTCALLWLAQGEDMAPGGCRGMLSRLLCARARAEAGRSRL